MALDQAVEAVHPSEPTVADGDSIKKMKKTQKRNFVNSQFFPGCHGDFFKIYFLISSKLVCSDNITFNFGL